jgi:hypothetical protein
MVQLPRTPRFEGLRVWLRVLLVMAVVLLPCATVHADEAVSVQIVQNDAQRIVIRFRIGDAVTRPITIDGEPWQTLALDDEPTRHEQGSPALPTIARSVAIPDDAHMEVRVLHTRHHDVHNIRIAPSRGLIWRTDDPSSVPYTFGTAYATDAMWPSTVADLGRPYIMRDRRGAVLRVHPFRYNPVQRTLRVYTEIEVELVRTGPGRINVLPARDGVDRSARSFGTLHAQRFINAPAGAPRALPEEEGELLIICHDAWLDAIAPLTAHKTATGIPTTVTAMSSVGTTAEDVKAYIQSVYDTSNLAFVLLVGDAEHVPTPYAALGPADPTYALLAGDDTYPDVFVGRFSAMTVADVQTQVARTIDYEQREILTEAWFNRAMGIASDQGPGDDGEMDFEHVDAIRDRLLAHGYAHVDALYDPGASWTDVRDGLNAGRGLVNYCGHGSWFGWNSSGFNSNDVNALTNINQWPLIVSCACNNGEFDGVTCFAETWMWATHTGRPTGAIAVYAASRGQYWDPPMAAQDEITDLLLGRAFGTVGALYFCGSCLMMDEYPAPHGEPFGGGVDMFDNWILFGDPSLRIYAPTGMRVLPTGGLVAKGPAGGPFVPEAQVYELANRNAAPMSFEVSVDVPWIDVQPASGTIAPGERVDVEVRINSLAMSFDDGMYEGAIQITNTSVHVGDCVRPIVLEVASPQMLHAFNMETDPGWTATGQWAYGVPTGDGGSEYGLPDPTSGVTGANVYGVNLEGDYTAEVGGPYYLTTEALDCSNAHGVHLSFARWLNTDYQPYVSASVEVSTDAQQWEVVWENPGSASDMTADAWSTHDLDLSAHADGQATVYVRWGYAIGEPDAFPYAGWNIDDVIITGMVDAPVCAADFDDSSNVGVNDFFALLQNWGMCPASPAACPWDIAPGGGDGDVGVDDFFALLQNWGPCR